MIAKWLAILSEHFSKELTATNADIYERALADLSVQEIEMACTAALQSCRFMPTVADIRQHINRAATVALACAGDNEWAGIMDRIWAWDEYYNTWGSGGQPELTAAGHHAVRACGGYTAIQQTEPGYRGPLKKRWDEAYSRFTENNQHLQLAAGYEKKLLSQIGDISKIKKM